MRPKTSEFGRERATGAQMRTKPTNIGQFGREPTKFGPSLTEARAEFGHFPPKFARYRSWPESGQHIGTHSPEHGAGSAEFEQTWRGIYSTWLGVGPRSARCWPPTSGRMRADIGPRSTKFGPMLTTSTTLGPQSWPEVEKHFSDVSHSWATGGGGTMCVLERPSSIAL